MKTVIQKVDINHITKEELKSACTILQRGGLVAFPTETVYGLGADGLNKEAAKKIYEAKGRPSDNPLILHISDIKALNDLAVNVSQAVYQLADAFWPGPLTMVLNKSEQVPYGTTGGLDTVAIRMPDHKLALALIEQSGIYIAAPSANTSGRPSPTKAKHVVDDLSGKIDLILDGGSVGIGIESTIVDMTAEIPVILRPGFISKEMLEEVLGEVRMDQAILGKKPDKNLIPKAPGMKYKHYAPKGQLTIVEGEEEKVTACINQLVAEKKAQNYRVGVIATDETKELYQDGMVRTIGSRKDESSIARGLYGVLREFDDLQADFIYTESFTEDALGQAIMNRLLKAAGYQVIIA